jgi:hypothetical protein
MSAVSDRKVIPSLDRLAEVVVKWIGVESTDAVKISGKKEKRCEFVLVFVLGGRIDGVFL